MKLIGLTGGIGSGKSTVSDILREKGMYVIDADEISREETKSGGSALKPILEHFGERVFNENGSLNRQALADIVFNDKNELKILEKMTTDVVIMKVKERVIDLENKGFNKPVILDAPLLIECGCQNECDEVWLVISPMEMRISRVMNRDNLTKEQILDRINNQLSDEEKMRYATRIIDNSADLDYLNEQINDLTKGLGY